MTPKDICDYFQNLASSIGYNKLMVHNALKATQCNVNYLLPKDQIQGELGRESARAIDRDPDFLMIVDPTL